MKYFATVLFIALLCQNMTEAQNLPDFSNVLVVYNSRSLNSIEIMNYYKNARGIPESNIVELIGLDTLTAITDTLDGSTHTIVLQQGVGNDKEIIADATILSYNPIYRHSWLYFVDRIASPIAEHLRTTFVNGTPLKDIIRFIVLCKGVPFRVLTHPDDGGSCNQNVAVDGLLCFLGEDIDNPYHLMDYLNMEGAVGGECQGTYEIENPYYNADPNFFINQNFIPNHYSSYNSRFERDITLSYLITHLDGMSVSDVKNMIDSSIAAINSSGYDWFIDSDPTPCHGSSQILNPSGTEDIFNALGISNYFIDNTNEVYIDHIKPVISYCSNGTQLIGAGLIKKKINLNSAIKVALEEKSSLAPKTYSKYKNVYQILANFATQKKIVALNEFTTQYADEYKRALLSPDVSPKTVNFYLNAAKSLFREYVLRKELTFNPFDHVRLERIQKKTLLEREDDYYTTQEIREFFAQPMLDNYKNAFIALFCTGMRFSEMSNLKWERIDLEKKMIQIRTNGDFRTKTLSSERDIPMSDKLFRVICALDKESDYVFLSTKGGKMSEKTLLSICKSTAKKANIRKNATLHKWRHSFNSHLAQERVDYSIRQYLMGHKPQTMTDHYTKIDPSKLHDQVSLLDKFLP